MKTPVRQGKVEETAIQDQIRELEAKLGNLRSNLDLQKGYNRFRGASRWQAFSRVVFPLVRPALLTGFAMAFARALGEYGSVIFISGNMPMRTQITPLLIVTKLEQYDYAGAAAIAAVMLVASFVLLLVINLLGSYSRKYLEAR